MIHTILTNLLNAVLGYVATGAVIALTKSRVIWLTTDTVLEFAKDMGLCTLFWPKWRHIDLEPEA